MLACGRGWAPRALERVITALPTSTRVAKVATDDGDAFVKGLGNPAGAGALASELVCAELAHWFGLYVPPFSVVDLSDLRIEMAGGGLVQPGPAFASRAVLGAEADGTSAFVANLVDKGAVARLIIFDTWVRNGDRCPPRDALDPEPRRDNLFFTIEGNKYQLTALDHTHCFVEGDLDLEISDPSIVEDDRIYGLFPEFAGFVEEADVRAAVARLGLIDAATVEEIVDSVPRQWGPPAHAREAWRRFILGRADYVANTITDKLLSQAVFSF